MIACSPFGPAGEFAASRHGAMTRSQAARQGLSNKVVRRLLRDGVIVEPVPGVLVAVGSPPTWRQRLYVATLASRSAGVAGARSAAALLGADDYRPGPLELLLPSGRHIDLDGVVLRTGPFYDEDVVEVDGIRCTGIARTLCDLGSIDPLPRVRLAFEWAWRTGSSLTWIEQTAARLDHPRRRGPRLLLALVDEARRHGRPTESALEVNVEAVICSLPGLVRQHVITRGDGTFLARVDFAIPDLKIAIEAHSRERHFGIGASASDDDREIALQSEGWIVRFVTEAHRRRPDTLRSSLVALILARSKV
jgi:very-short-patch-repair endonuclease